MQLNLWASLCASVGRLHLWSRPLRLVARAVVSRLCMGPAATRQVLISWSSTNLLLAWVAFLVHVQVGALCLGCAVLMGSAGKAIVTINLLLLTFILFSGFLANKGSIHWVLRWVCYVSPIRCVFCACVINACSVLGTPALGCGHHNMHACVLPLACGFRTSCVFVRLLGCAAGVG